MSKSPLQSAAVKTATDTEPTLARDDAPLAIAEFGTPTYAFSGSAADIVNSGDGGAFTKNGTVTDYTPAP